MKRPDDWPSRLATFLREKEAQPFVWGANDCCLFTCDWLAILTGTDHAAPYRGTYASALGAARLLAEHGGTVGLASAVAAREGWLEIAPAFAQRGDIVAGATDEHGPALGVCVGSVCAFAGPLGVALQPTRASVKAWRVG